MFWVRIAGTLAIIWSLFQMYTAGFGFYNAMIMRPVHISLALAITFLTYTRKGKGGEDGETATTPRWQDYIPALISLGIGLYFILNQERIISRQNFVDPVFLWDMICSGILVLFILEAGRRLFGKILPLIVIVFLAYQFFGQSLPGILSHRGIDFIKFTEMQLLSTSGIFGIPLGVSTDTVFYFLLFGAFLEISGGGKFFIDLALKATGRYRGGPAKVAVVASGLMGMINGSAVGNVAGTGVFTIPLMKKIGYSPVFAGAVEAVASTGGQIMPPIMGAAVFVLAQFVGIPYTQIAVSAIVPALLFYIALFVAVDIRAKERNLVGIQWSKINESENKWWLRSFLLLPVFILIILMVKGFTLQYAALFATLSVIPVGFLSSSTHLKFSSIVSALEATGKKAVVVAVPCALAGIMVGVVTYTGLGAKFSAFLIQLSGGHLLPTLMLVMLSCLIMGMAMPTTAAYIITAVLMAPALTEIGVEPLAAHMFIFYFSILSMVTPPIALAAFTGAGIAGADLMKTGFQAWFLSLSGFIIPYAFVFNTALLAQGTLFEILRTALGAAVGTYALGKAVVSDKISYYLRGLYLASGFLLISPDIFTDILGIILLFISLLVHKRKYSILQNFKE
jgi:TRAP transporter 4TM/12TM fusion protein